MEKISYKEVDEYFLCPHYERVSWSLEEEMDACHSCEYFCDDDWTCRREENNK